MKRGTGQSRRWIPAAFAAFLLALLLPKLELSAVEMVLLAGSAMLAALVLLSYYQSDLTTLMLQMGLDEFFSLMSTPFIEEEEEGGQPLDLDSFASHARVFLVLLCALTLLYWYGVKTYVDKRLALAGAVIATLELIANLEILSHLSSRRGARYKPRTAELITKVYKAAALLHLALICATVFVIVHRSMPAP